jgi:hypothetical protein
MRGFSSRSELHTPLAVSAAEDIPSSHDGRGEIAISCVWLLRSLIGLESSGENRCR